VALPPLGPPLRRDPPGGREAPLGPPGLGNDRRRLPAGAPPPAWADLPLVLYFHENQLTYPLPPGEPRDLHYAWAQVLSCKAARLCVFNSPFQKEDFLRALPGFLRSFPDHRPLHLTEEIRRKSRVVPPGADTERFREAARGIAPPESPLRIFWNHRWEKDKGPGEFLEVLLDLARRGVPFQVVLAGPGSEDPGPALEEKIRALGDRVVHRGYASPETYPELAASCHVLVSTAAHDFFGISVVEGMAAGLLPLLPRRQNYPNLVPPELAERCLYDGPAGLARALLREGEDPAGARRAGRRAAEAARAFDVKKTAPALDDLLEEAVRPPGEREEERRP